MEFEYDPAKSESNLSKHGIDFDGAQGLWQDRGMVAVPVRRGGETRWVAIARMGGSCWAAVYTMRGSVTRIISVRRATPKEVSAYDKANQ